MNISHIRPSVCLLKWTEVPTTYLCILSRYVIGTYYYASNIDNSNVT